MDEMTTYGVGDLAEGGGPDPGPALRREGWGDRRCTVYDTQWQGAGPGLSQVHLDGAVWTGYDYKEEVPMGEEIAGILGVPEPCMERRQCVTKVVAAGTLWLHGGDVPAMEAVSEAAAELRLEQARQAVEASQLMGKAAERVSAVEHELRGYTHDIITSHHDRDVRSYAVFPVHALAEIKMVVVRPDYKGDYSIETITGPQWQPEGTVLCALIWRGHMQLLRPPTLRAAQQLCHQPATYDTPTMGFHYFWHQRVDQPLVAPGNPPCRLCRPPRRAGEGTCAWVPRAQSCLAALALAGTADGGALAVRAAGQGKGLRLLEVFAGCGVLTRGWERHGSPAEVPVELYGDPHRRKDPRPDHDVTDPAVQRRLLHDVRAGQFNVLWIASPCTSFCDWQLQNGGTRTFTNPLGGPTWTPNEVIGNKLSTFSAQQFKAALDAQVFVIAESSGPSGRYPKQWNLPAWQKLLRRPDVDFVEFDMCAFGLGPPAEPGHYYRHRTAVAFPRHPALKAALMKRCPGIGPQHQHVGLQGSRQGQSVTRCTEAGVYSELFVQTVITVLHETLVPAAGRTGGGGGTGTADTAPRDPGGAEGCGNAEECRAETIGQGKAGGGGGQGRAVSGRRGIAMTITVMRIGPWQPKRAGAGDRAGRRPWNGPEPRRQRRDAGGGGSDRGGDGGATGGL